MKNTRKNVLPLLLAGVLLLSAGAYGTRAYFTDSAEQELDIKLTIGNLDIENETNSVWVYAPVGSGEYVVNDQLKKLVGTVEQEIDGLEIGTGLGTDISLMNVRPGDAFERNISFANRGTLTQKIAIDKTKFEETDPYTVTITSDLMDLNDSSVEGFILEPNKIVTYSVKISVSGLIDEVDMAKLTLDYLSEKLEVTALQPNDNTTIIN